HSIAPVKARGRVVSKRDRPVVGQALCAPSLCLATEAVALQLCSFVAARVEPSAAPPRAGADKSKRYLDPARRRDGRFRPMWKQRAQRFAASDARPNIRSAS